MSAPKFKTSSDNSSDNLSILRDFLTIDCKIKCCTCKKKNLFITQMILNVLMYLGCTNIMFYMYIKRAAHSISLITFQQTYLTLLST